MVDTAMQGQCEDERDQPLLVVESLRQVHHREHSEHDDGGPNGAPPPLQDAEREPEREQPAERAESVCRGLGASGLECLEERLAPRIVG